MRGSRRSFCDYQDCSLFSVYEIKVFLFKKRDGKLRGIKKCEVLPREYREPKLHQ